VKKAIALLFLVSLFVTTSNAQTDTISKQKAKTVVKTGKAKAVKKQSTATTNNGAVILKKEMPNQMENKAVKMEKAKKENSK
jgi:hypothetical protein